jgi:type IV pilus biogenesis protein CpaD/CtpE
MNTGRVRITLILAVLALGSGCASQQPATTQQAILSAEQLESMIRIEVRSIGPAESDAIVAANDQP